jgi:ribosomal protein S6
MAGVRNPRLHRKIGNEDGFFNMKKYDAMYIFANVAKEDSIDGLVEKASNEITRLNGKVLNTQVLGKKSFARTMQKKESGVYVKIRFEIDPAQVALLQSRYHLLEDFFRVQILTVDARREAAIIKQTEEQKVRDAAKAAAMERNAQDDAGANNADEV